MSATSKPRPRRRRARAGLTCPTCSGVLRLLYTRQRSSYITRRRQCTSCGERFTTAERIVGTKKEKSVAVPLVLESVTLLLESCGINTTDPAELRRVLIGDHANEHHPEPRRAAEPH